MRICIQQFFHAVILLGGALGVFAAEPKLTGKASAPGAPISLWYRQPAAKWEEALAITRARLAPNQIGATRPQSS